MHLTNQYLRTYVPAWQKTFDAKDCKICFEKVISYIVANVEAISQRTLSDQQYNQLEQEAATIIKRSGFIKEDEIFSTKPKN